MYNVKRLLCHDCLGVFSEPLCSVSAGKHQTYRYTNAKTEWTKHNTLDHVFACLDGFI